MRHTQKFGGGPRSCGCRRNHLPVEAPVKIRRIGARCRGPCQNATGKTKRIFIAVYRGLGSLGAAGGAGSLGADGDGFGSLGSAGDVADVAAEVDAILVEKEPA